MSSKQALIDIWTDLVVQQQTQLLIAALIASLRALLQLSEGDVLQHIISPFLIWPWSSAFGTGRGRSDVIKISHASGPD
jgi:hypothetical protein